MSTGPELPDDVRWNPLGDPLSPHAFLDALRGRGVRVWSNGGGRLCVAPRKKLSREEKSYLRANGAALLALVLAPSNLAPAPAPAEPTPAVWTVDYRRRITDEDVRDVFGSVRPAGMTRREAYEQTRDTLAERARQRRSVEMMAEMRAYLAGGAPLDGEPPPELPDALTKRRT